MIDADAVRQVPEPLTGHALGELGLVSARSGGLTVHAISEDGDYISRLRSGIEAAVGRRGVASVEVVAAGEHERQTVANRLRERHRRPGALASRTQVYAVASGKGGVGKSTVTANLAAALARSGRRVGVLDADVWGYSIPLLFGTRSAPVAVPGIMLPVMAEGVRLMSMGFFVAEDQPIVWRGPMLQRAVEQFLDDVYWGDDLDVLLVDLPPGTGDVPMTIASLLPDAALLVVTTPQRAATSVAARVGRMALDARMPVAGVIENMSGGPFGTGGGADLAARLDTTLLGRIALDRSIAEAADRGRPVVSDAPASEGALELERIARELPRPQRSLAGRSLPLFVEAGHAR